MKQLTALAIGAMLMPSLAAAAAAECTTVAGSVTVAVHVQAPSQPKASAVTLVVSYPPTVAIPGRAADPTVAARVQTSLTNATLAVNDSGHDLRVALARGTGIAAGQVLAIHFDRCDGKVPVTADSFKCRVEGAGSAAGTVQQVDCTVQVVTK